MKLFTINNETNLDTSVFEELANVFVPYHQQELQWRKPVNINLVSDEENSINPLGKTAYYDPNEELIVLYLDNRHVKDILRSLSHELVHHYQNCKGVLTPVQGEDPQYAQNDDNLRKCEEEAYLVGNMLFRDWEDNYKNSDKLNEGFSHPRLEKYRYLVTWNHPGGDELFIVEYPDGNELPDENNFKSNAKIQLRKYINRFPHKGVLTFWELDRSVDGITDVYQYGDVVPAAAIDFGVAGDYKVRATQNTISQKDMFRIVQESMMNFKEMLPDKLENEIIGSINLNKTTKNRKWIGTVVYGKNEISISYFWTTLGTKFFVVADSSLYGPEVIDAPFDSKKEARSFAISKMKEVSYETEITSMKTYKDYSKEKRDSKGYTKKLRSYQYESVSDRKENHMIKLQEKLYKRFNIYHKIGEE